MEKERATVALIQSAKEIAEHLTESDIRAMVREVVSLAGGLDFISDGQTVVIKPNLVTTRSHQGPFKPGIMALTDAHKTERQIPQFVNGITSDRRVVRAMVELVREKNPSGRLLIMESSGDGLTSKHMKQMGFTHENLPGVDDIIAIGEEGSYRDLNSEELVGVTVKNQLYTRMPKWMNNKYYFDKTYYSADVIISMCCLKNHVNAAVTGGIKNVGIGAKPHSVYAMSKSKSLSLTTINHFGVNIHHFIHDYYSAKPVHFVLTDGLQGLAYGPGAMGAPSYDEAKMNMRLLMASRDAVAIDTVHSCIVGVDPEKVEYINDLAKDGFGVADTKQIDVVGNVRVDQVKKRFPLPSGISGGVLSLAVKDIKARWYDDYSGPKCTEIDVQLDGDSINVNLKLEEKATKIEVLLDGKKIKVFAGDLSFLQCPLPARFGAGEHTLTLLIYDRYLNCSRRTKKIIIDCGSGEYPDSNDVTVNAGFCFP